MKFDDELMINGRKFFNYRLVDQTGKTRRFQGVYLNMTA